MNSCLLTLYCGLEKFLIQLVIWTFLDDVFFLYPDLEVTWQGTQIRLKSLWVNTTAYNPRLAAAGAAVTEKLAREQLSSFLHEKPARRLRKKLKYHKRKFIYF